MTDQATRPYRSLWELRLSTAIVLMLATGALLGLYIDRGGWPMRMSEPGGLLLDLLSHSGIIFAAFVATQVWMEAAEGN